MAGFADGRGDQEVNATGGLLAPRVGGLAAREETRTSSCLQLQGTWLSQQTEGMWEWIIPQRLQKAIQPALVTLGLLCDHF